MTYALAAPLQQAIFARLASDPALGALVGTAIFDAAPAGPVPPLYIALGPEEVRDRSDKTSRAALHRFSVSVVSEGGGFHTAKSVAGAVEAALTTAPIALSRGHIVALDFERAEARREQNGKRRRVDLRFRAMVDDSQSHSI